MLSARNVFSFFISLAITYVADAFNIGGEKRGQAVTPTKGFGAGAVLKSRISLISLHFVGAAQKQMSCDQNSKYLDLLFFLQAFILTIGSSMHALIGANSARMSPANIFCNFVLFFCHCSCLHDQSATSLPDSPARSDLLSG